MIDAILPLAFTVQANKGATAILLGSGVSRNAEIPTGWEVTLDLVKKLAVAQSAEEPTDPKSWYVEKFGKDPGYDEVLALLAPSAPQRHALVRGYFEPTLEEREEGLKQPTKAHRAIAELVSKGFVRVIVTTNFDRLMEQALGEVGIAPTVVTSADGIKGATPLPHIRCLVLKVHGDYHDNRILNSPEELATYDPEMARYVARIAEDFGIVVAGWSGEYDVALSAALAEGRGRAAYPLYWCSRGKPGTRAQAFIGACRGTEIAVAGADEFFVDLLDKVTSLEALAGPRPMTTAVAVATAKRLIEARESGAIRLHDLVTGEARRVAEQLRNPQTLAPGNIDRDGFRRLTTEMEDTARTLAHLFAQGAFWGASAGPFVQALGTIGKPGSFLDRYPALETFRLYPAALCYYAAGVASVLSGSFRLFRDLSATDVNNGTTEPARFALLANMVVEQQNGRLWEGMEQARMPGADRILETVKPALLDFASNEGALIQAFDQFEFLAAMDHADRQWPGKELNEEERRREWVPFSTFTWRSRGRGRRQGRTFLGVTDEVHRAIETEGSGWGPLQAGFFGKEKMRAYVAASNVDNILASHPSISW